MVPFRMRMAQAASGAATVDGLGMGKKVGGAFSPDKVKDLPVLASRIGGGTHT